MAEDQKRTQEPMLKFNGSGYGVKWATVLQFAVLVIGGIIAFTMDRDSHWAVNEGAVSICCV